jgi:hypothetical protein
VSVTELPSGGPESPVLARDRDTRLVPLVRRIAP